MSLKISFEFFPPKTEEGLEDLLNNAKRLTDYVHEFFSVTYGAGGSTRQGTLNTVSKLQQQTKTPIAPHLSCVGSSIVDLTDIVNIYKDMNLKHIVAIRGDLPSGMGTLGEVPYASDLIKLIRNTANDHFHIQVGAYPECHPQSEHAEMDFAHFHKKVDAGANGAITQYFYNADAYFNFMDKCIQKNITIPIVPGIMPINNFAKLVRFSEMCGAEIPQWMRKQLSAYQDDSESIKAFGLDVVTNLCERLISGGAPGLHFYTLNNVNTTLELLERLKVKKKK